MADLTAKWQHRSLQIDQCLFFFRGYLTLFHVTVVGEREKTS